MNSQTPAQPKGGLYFNQIPVTLSASKIQVGELPYTTPEALIQLRTEYRATHVFHREGDRIKNAVITAETTPLGELQDLEIDDNPGFVRHLIDDALIQHYAKKGLLFSSFSPIQYIIRAENLLLRGLQTQWAEKIAFLKVNPEYELSTRFLYSAGKSTFGIAVGISTRWSVEATVAELLSLSVKLEGKYVVQHFPPSSPLRDPLSCVRLMGRVVRITESTVELEDHREEDPDHLEADMCNLAGRRENFRICLGAFLPANVISQIRDQLETAVFELTGAEGVVKQIDALHSALTAESPIVCTPELSFVAQPRRPVKYGIGAGRFQHLQRPIFVFQPGGAKTSTWHDDGLNEYGPFDSEMFPKKSPNILVIVPEEWKGDAETFVRYFKDGIPPAELARGRKQPQKQYFAKGFVRKYHLTDANFEFRQFALGNNPAQSYRTACLEALAQGISYDLAIVFIREAYHELQGDANPYLVSKSLIMSQGVPVQEIEIETIKVYLTQLQYILNNISLASYAKLGGTPWTIASPRGMAHELVIGVGSHQLQEGMLGPRQRFVGISTVFSADGTYLMSNTSKEVEFGDYQQELLTTLRSTLEEIEKRNAWMKGDTVRLVFHIFKRIKDTEALAIKSVAEELNDYTVELAIVHLSEDHQWELYDYASAGIQDWAPVEPRFKGKLKGKFVPERGICVPIDQHQALLTLTGPRQLKTPVQGCPHPLLINLHRESTFKSLEYLTKQVFDFSFLSWRSFFPSTRPVTILYSDRIAELLGELRGVSNWNPDILKTKLRGSRWFL